MLEYNNQFDIRTKTMALQKSNGTQFYSRTYTSDQYNNEIWREKVKRVAGVLPELMDRIGAQCVVVTGKSGMSMAFSLSMLIDLDFIVVRKESETHHGCPVEGPKGLAFTDYLIMDDFVDEGTTCKNIMKAMTDYSDGKMNCLGVVTYDIEKYTSDIEHSYMIGDVEIDHYPV